MNQQQLKKAGHLLALEWKAKKRTNPHQTPRERGWYFNPDKKDIVRLANC